MLQNEITHQETAGFLYQPRTFLLIVVIHSHKTLPFTCGRAISVEHYETGHSLSCVLRTRLRNPTRPPALRLGCPTWSASRGHAHWRASASSQRPSSGDGLRHACMGDAWTIGLAFTLRSPCSSCMHAPSNFDTRADKTVNAS